MVYMLEIERLENKSKKEIEKEIKYISEDNEELRREVEVGKQAECELKKNEHRLVQLMQCYLKKGEI